MAVLRFRARPWHREDHADLQRRPVPGAQPRRDARYDTGTGGGASDLAHGCENLGGLGDIDEQGPRADRGASAFPARPRAHRHRRPPAIDRAWAGDLPRRLRPGPSRLARYADPDRLRAGVARPPARPPPRGAATPA